MRVVCHLEVDANSFFDYLQLAIEEDVKQTSEKKIRKLDIKEGFTYTKKIKTKTKQMDKTKVTIEKFKRPTCYRVRFDGSQGQNYIYYEIHEDTEGGIDVIYEESFHSAQKSKSWNYRLLSKLFERSSRKRILRNLRGVEAYILENKENEAY